MDGTQKTEEKTEESSNVNGEAPQATNNKTHPVEDEKRSAYVRADVERAIGSGRYLTFSCHVADGKLHSGPLICQDFPNGDFKTAVRVFQQECGNIIRRADVPEGVEVPGLTDGKGKGKGKVIDVESKEVSDDDK
ncbi:MAG: hypothetical protein GY832_24240 [Chloroflexi bacterium]|nr:hypothetical protein [Chloroflexota bacterium]